MQSIHDGGGELVVPEEMERWSRAVQLQLHFLNDREYQNIIRQDIAPRYRAFMQPSPADRQRLATSEYRNQDWSKHRVLARVPAGMVGDVLFDPVERAAHAEYLVAVYALVRDRMRLTWRGEPVSWALRMVQADAHRALLPASDPESRVLRYENAPTPMQQSSFVLTGSPNRLHLEASGMTPIEQWSYGRDGLGFGREEWDEWERQAIELVRQGLRQIRQQFEEAYGQLPHRRAAALARDEQTLEALFRFLFHRRSPVGSSGPSSRREMLKISKLLGIDLPRR